MTLLDLPFYDFIKRHYDYPELFDTKDYWLVVVVSFSLLIVAIILLSLICSWVYDYIDSKKGFWEQLEGKLIDKKYIGEQNTSGSGMAVMPSSNGGVGVGMISTNSHADEQFLFFVKSDKIYKVNVSMEMYYQYNVGDKIIVGVKIGGISGEDLQTGVVTKNI